MNMRQYEASLNLFERHLCCDDAGYYLFPPRKSGKWGNMTFFSIDTWHIDLGDGGPLLIVQFCPFCGEKLEAKE